MANRRNYGGNRPSGVNPWQSGSSPGRAPPLLNHNLLNQLTSPDSQLALATKLLSSILPVQGQPPSLMSLGGGYGPRYGGGSGGNYGGGDRFRRDDRRDNFRNRRAPNDRHRDRKAGDKGRFEKTRKPGDDADAKEAASKDTKDDSEAKDESMNEDDAEKKPEGEEDVEKGKEKDPTGPLPGYENIPAKLYHCHVCGKSMWNDVSFDTHVKGRNHRNKLRDLEESYQLQTDLMRQIAAISLKLEEIRRGKRRPYPDQYCKMCDLHFNGMTMFAHRATDEHQSLKRFIHPSCDLCNMDFQVRIEYDEHVLTAGHLQQEAKALARREKYDKDPKYVLLREQEAKLRLLLEEVGDLGSAGGGPELSEEDRKLVDEHGEVPAYDPDAENLIARQHVAPVEGFLCKVCRVFLLAPETVDVHCRTQKHYESYVNQLKNEAIKRQKEKEKESGDEKRKLDDTADDGVAKRRKTDSEEQDGDAQEETVNGSDTQITEEDNKEEEPKESVEAEAPKTTPSPKNSARRGRGRTRR